MNLAVAQELLDHVARCDAKHGKLLLPQMFEESHKFVAAVDEFLQGFPSHFGYGAPQQHRAAAKARTTKACGTASEGDSARLARSKSTHHEEACGAASEGDSARLVRRLLA